MQDKIDLQFIEGERACFRIAELAEEPIKGCFDIPHLKEINRYIFQDMPLVSAEAAKIYTPGEFRTAVPKGRDWIKQRPLLSVGRVSYVAYSAMDEAAVRKLGSLLEMADPCSLSRLQQHDFADTIADLYADLDYIHPFPEGNSRTLREFTRTLALNAGYFIDWSVFNINDRSRDVLYVARDLAVNDRALSSLVDEGTKRDVYYTIDTFAGNDSLRKLLNNVIRKL